MNGCTMGKNLINVTNVIIPRCIKLISVHTWWPTAGKSSSNVRYVLLHFIQGVQWNITRSLTQKKSHMHAISAIFQQKEKKFWRCTGKCIMERNPITVNSVNILHCTPAIWKNTWWCLIVKTLLLIVKNVGKHSRVLYIWKGIYPGQCNMAP